MIAFEDQISWQGFLERQRNREAVAEEEIGHLHTIQGGRNLHKSKQEKKRKKKLKKLFADPGIQVDTMHGLMIDAGSTGSRMHVYEFKKRILEGENEISDAVSGKKLSYPGTESRWTERLRPGLASFSTKSDEELLPAIAEYLFPLLEFAKTVLHTKREKWPEFPIYLKATAGMRMLEPQQRVRIIHAVRELFNNSTFSGFKFQTDYARVISGEEEAIYGWAGANFVLGSLLKSSEGSGTVVNPKLTHGALEMGGASTQISFYQDNEDIMSNLFKLQIGQGKHWNVYAHSHLLFGINEAWDRFGATLLSNNNSSDVGTLVNNPCLASQVVFESNIYYEGGDARWRVDDNGNPILYKKTMTNQNKIGNYDECAKIAYTILNKQYNVWCDFSHRGDCSFSGVYQPTLPKQSKNFGEFLAFSNYYHIWQFLKIPDRSPLSTLEQGARKVCSMNATELKEWNDGGLESDLVPQMCFRASYVFQVLRNGYGFQMEDVITAKDVVNGHKVGWALGSMLYEINTLPWTYIPKKDVAAYNAYFHGKKDFLFNFLGAILICVCIGFCLILRTYRRRNNRHVKIQYSSIEDVELKPGKTDESSAETNS